MGLFKVANFSIHVTMCEVGGWDCKVFQAMTIIY